MKSISTNCKTNSTLKVLSDAEHRYSIVIRDDIQSFLSINSGGYPIKNIIICDGEEYEVRVFLSLDDKDSNYFIQKPLDFFLKKTNGKIIPIGIDSGDNYYCVNNETGKVYYWSSSEDSYYNISNTLNDFILLFS